MNQKIRYIITRREVETLDFDRFFQTFGPWPFMHGADLRERYDQLDLWIAGYDPLADEELYLIPEVRAYVRRLHQAWPWVFFFLHLDDEMLMIWTLCLMEEVSCVRREGARMCQATFNSHEMLNRLALEYGHMNRLFERAKLSEAENTRRSQALVEKFFPGISKHLEGTEK